MPVSRSLATIGRLGSTVQLLCRVAGASSSSHMTDHPLLVLPSIRILAFQLPLDITTVEPAPVARLQTMLHRPRSLKSGGYTRRPWLSFRDTLFCQQSFLRDRGI